MEQNSSETINGIALPLNDLQSELQRSQPKTLNGNPANILLNLPKGTGFVLRFSSNERDQMTRIRRSFTEAAADLRAKDTSRGLLMTSARVEADVISLYAWFTADDAQEHAETNAGMQSNESLVTSKKETLQEGATGQDANRTSSTADEPPASNEQPLILAAAALGVSVKTVRRAIKSGRLPARLIPGPHGPEYRVDITKMLATSSSNQHLKREEPDSKGSSARKKSPPKEKEAIALLSQRINDLENKINQISQ